eukprot:Skav212600  [mRNA]  locus=scaffold2176:28805:34014:- [translate_table: standard]
MQLLLLIACVAAVRRDDVETLAEVTDFTDAQDTREAIPERSNRSKPAPAAIGEQLSAEDMQLRLVEFLNSKRILHKSHAKHKGADEFLEGLKRPKDRASPCQKELGHLLENLVHKCENSTRKVDRKAHLSTSDCELSANRIFRNGSDFVLAQLREKEDSNAGNLDSLAKWIFQLATLEKDGILWCGFWTNASDPEGNKSRTSKENLFEFAESITTQTVHPGTTIGNLVHQSEDLADCQSSLENHLIRNMWSLFSFAFVQGMRERRQHTIVALVHKRLDGERPLNKSVLFQDEMPGLGVEAWGRGFWSPQIVVIDLLGTCNQTSPLLRQQLYSALPGFYRSGSRASVRDFSYRSRLSWTCLNCPDCQLDEDLADQAKEEQDANSANLMEAVKKDNGPMVKQLLEKKADVNFQDLATGKDRV